MRDKRRRRGVLVVVLLYSGCCASLASASSDNRGANNGWGNPPPPPPPYTQQQQEQQSQEDPYQMNQQGSNQETAAASATQYEGEAYVVGDQYSTTNMDDHDYYGSGQGNYEDRTQQPPPPSSSEERWINPSRDRPPSRPDTPSSSSTTTKYEPIHYNFPKEKEEKRGFFGRRGRKQQQKEHEKREALATAKGEPLVDEIGIPETAVLPPPRDEDVEQEQMSSRREQRRDEPEYASARRDVVTRYQSTAKGKLSLALSSGVAGSMLGAFLGKSILNNPTPLAITCFGIFVLCTILRNPYGELVRALGMALILALQRTTSIRRRYPTWRHVKASLGATPRRNFPPSSNPWNYQPRDRRDPEFKMLYTLIAMAFVGSTCGGSIPLIPTWIGSLAGAGFFGLSTTLQSSRGDLSRTMGMRVVALCEEMLGINTELEILRKGGVVSGKILDKLFILDRKHRIKDRLIAGATFLYRQVNAQVNRVQNDMNRPPGGGDDDADRRRNRRDDPRDERDRRDERRDDRGGGGRDRRDDRDRRDNPRDNWDRRDDRDRRDERDDRDWRNSRDYERDQRPDPRDSSFDRRRGDR